MSTPGNEPPNTPREPIWRWWRRALLILVGPGAGVRRWLLLGAIGGGVIGVGDTLAESTVS